MKFQNCEDRAVMRNTNYTGPACYFEPVRCVATNGFSVSSLHLPAHVSCQSPQCLRQPETVAHNHLQRAGSWPSQAGNGYKAITRKRSQAQRCLRNR